MRGAPGRDRLERGKVRAGRPAASAAEPQLRDGKLAVMASPVYTAEDAAYWYAPLARAVPAAALACVVTFAGGFYTPEYGLASFGGYAIVAGLLGVFLSIRALSGGVLRTVFLIQAIVSVAAGGAALVG